MDQNQRYHQQQPPSRKRTYDEMRSFHPECNNPSLRASANSKRLRRNDNPRSSSRRKRRGNDTDSQAEESGMEDDAGGSSQDEYEADFIDDGKKE